ncbi:MAG: diaminopimelate decarboxylase [bacterium]
MFQPAFINKFQSLETPFYFYDIDVLEQTLGRLQQFCGKSGYKVHYALKANANERILEKIKACGFGADCVSGNEVKRALAIGFPPEKIVFAGVGKTDAEILTALENDIFCFNCESLQEIEIIDRLAGDSKRTAGIALRINPNVPAQTHDYITTGLEENKFGIHFREMEKALALFKQRHHIRLLGLHFHIGSQITHMSVFQDFCVSVNEIQRRLLDRPISIEHLSLGGGLGVDYHNPDFLPDFENYFEVFRQFLEPPPGQSIHFELGRSVTAQCGSLMCRVLYVKKGMETTFVILDAGMTELIRPALYQSYHKIENLTSTGPPEEYDVVGPICESSDCFGKAVTLPQTRRGDLIAIRSTGAYGEVMASRYNLRDWAPAVFSDKF